MILPLIAITLLASVGTVLVIGLDIPRDEPAAVFIDVCAASAVSYLLWLIAGTILKVNFKLSGWLYFAKRWLIPVALAVVLTFWIRDLPTAARATLQMIGVFLALGLVGIFLWITVFSRSDSAKEEGDPPPHPES